MLRLVITIIWISPQLIYHIARIIVLAFRALPAFHRLLRGRSRLREIEMERLDRLRNPERYLR
jgi:hypothetical protein